MHFRKICIATAVLLAVTSFFCSTILTEPSLRWLAVYGSKIVGVAAGYFLLIALRTHVICSQLSRGRPQMFDRPAPEWITLLFIVGGLVIVFRPL